MIDIVIVNWNSGDFLCNCIASIFEVDSEKLVSKIIVVDNASTDDSLGKVLGLCNGLDGFLDIVRLEDNFGFAAACNIGAAHGVSDVILFLNPDVVLSRGNLANAFKTLTGDQSIGVVGIQLVDENQKYTTSAARFPSAGGYLNLALGLSYLLPMAFKRNHLVEDEYLESSCVDQVMGAFLMIPRELFRSLDGFDERFFMYMDEVDLCWRVKHILFKNVVTIPAEKAFHFGGGCSNSIPNLRVFYSLRSRLIFFRKNLGLFQRLSIYCVTFGVEFPSRCCFYILTLRPRRLWGILKVYFELSKFALGYGSNRAVENLR